MSEILPNQWSTRTRTDVSSGATPQPGLNNTFRTIFDALSVLSTPQQGQVPGKAPEPTDASKTDAANIENLSEQTDTRPNEGNERKLIAADWPHETETDWHDENKWLRDINIDSETGMPLTNDSATTLAQGRKTLELPSEPLLVSVSTSVPDRPKPSSSIPLSEGNEFLFQSEIFMASGDGPEVMQSLHPQRSATQFSLMKPNADALPVQEVAVQATRPPISEDFNHQFAENAIENKVSISEAVKPVASNIENLFSIAGEKRNSLQILASELTDLNPDALKSLKGSVVSENSRGSQETSFNTKPRIREYSESEELTSIAPEMIAYSVIHSSGKSLQGGLRADPSEIFRPSLAAGSKNEERSKQPLTRDLSLPEAVGNVTERKIDISSAQPDLKFEKTFKVDGETDATALGVSSQEWSAVAQNTGIFPSGHAATTQVFAGIKEPIVGFVLASARVFSKDQTSTPETGIKAPVFDQTGQTNSPDPLATSMRSRWAQNLMPKQSVNSIPIRDDHVSVFVKHEIHTDPDAAHALPTFSADKVVLNRSATPVTEKVANAGNSLADRMLGDNRRPSVVLDSKSEPEIIRSTSEVIGKESARSLHSELSSEETVRRIVQPGYSPVKQTLEAMLVTDSLQSVRPVIDMQNSILSEVSGVQKTYPDMLDGSMNYRPEVRPEIRLNAMAPDLPRQIAQNLFADSARAEGGGIELRLSPEELGPVRLNLRQVDGQMIVQISVDRVETLDLMRRHADQLMQEMRSLGYTSVRLDMQAQGDRRPSLPYQAAPQPDEPTMASALSATNETPHRRNQSSGLDLRL